jgi:hypothetical protein
MVLVSDPDLSWAITKAALVVVSALTSVVCLAWAGGRIAFPSESEEQRVEEKTTDSGPSSRARPRDANWPYGSEVAPRVLCPIRKVLVAEFYLANIASFTMVDYPSSPPASDFQRSPEPHANQQ